MKHFRYILLCLSLIAAVGLMVGCSCGNPQDETSDTSTSESSSVGMTESQTQESTRETMPESSSDPTDIYETGNGSDDVTGGMENGGNTNGGTNGGSTNGGSTNGGTTNGGNETGESGGLMEDVTDGLEQIGEDITGAMDDAAGGTRTRR